MFSFHLIRIIEIIISLFFLFILLPLYLIIIVILFFSQGFPIFYISNRIGKNGAEFTIYKFRTMTNKSNEDDKDEITKIGKYFRKLSLDEIPQLFNILKGEMSLVGPRPLPYDIENKINIEDKKIRRSIRPGLTGYAQINYKKNRPFNDKVTDDIFFVKNYSLIFYFKIIVLTFPIILKKFFL